MSRRFWRLQAPDYDSDDQDTYVNGSFDRSHGMPGIRCVSCGQTWGDSRVMPFPCPPAMRSHPNLLDAAPIPSPDHRELRRLVLAALRREGFASDLDEATIRGDFLGGDLSVPSRPRADFLWPTLGSLIVSRRVRDVLIDSASGAVAAAPVTLAKIGRREANLQPPSSVEPEELVERLAVERPALDAGPYFEVAMCRESGDALGNLKPTNVSLTPLGPAA